ncbi:MAG: haloacid dehalogenase, family protein, partial [Verrucomicrobiales bacterium]|nr:haloacid dehalogenase, family protein [Verrucomicrobiales bacterium]
DPEIVTGCFYRAWKKRGQFDYTREAWSELVSASFQDFGVISPECFSAIYEAFAEPSAWRIFPDVLPALAALRSANMRMGIISNWDERLRPLLRALHLSDYFEEITISHEVGYSKPKRQIFQAAMKALRLPASQILHVGDGHREDFEGAREAGFAALLLDRSKARIGGQTIANLECLLSPEASRTL